MASVLGIYSIQLRQKYESISSVTQYLHSVLAHLKQKYNSSRLYSFPQGQRKWIKGVVLVVKLYILFFINIKISNLLKNSILVILKCQKK